MIDKIWKKQLAGRFGAASVSYENQSEVQQQSASALANLISNSCSQSQAIRILEIGCGTGYLTRELVRRFPHSEIVVSDISQAMLDRCAENLSVLGAGNGDFCKNVTFREMDGEDPNLEGKFDLICSNMAFQWFHDLEEALHKLTNFLSPQGKLIFSSLSSDTFKLWHQCQDDLGVARLAPEFPADNFYPLAMPQLSVRTELHPFVQRHKSGLDFLKNLKEIGAHSSRVGRDILGAGQLRTLIKKYESYFKSPDIEADYEVVFVLCSKNG